MFRWRGILSNQKNETQIKTDENEKHIYTQNKQTKNIWRKQKISTNNIKSRGI